MARFRWLVAWSVLAGLLATLGGVRAQTVPSQYFPETGHTVRGDFLNFFSARGGLEFFGYPITEAFVENGQQVQYFQHMRLDAYPENPDPFRVETGPLGVVLGRVDPPIPPSDIPASGDPVRRYFPETGHTVSYAFLAFFVNRGGVELFGFPITEFKLENGRIVQYFQRARMEWYPDLPAERRVQLGELGAAYAAQHLSQDVLRPPPASLAQQAIQVVMLKPVISLQAAVTGRTGTQKLHVYVMDQQGRPVSQASVTAVVHFPSGDRELVLPQTDERGYTEDVFELGQLVPGQRVTLSVQVKYDTLSASTRTSFLVWW